MRCTSHRLRKVDATVHGNAFKVNESREKKTNAEQHMKELNRTKKSTDRLSEEERKNGEKKSV